MCGSLRRAAGARTHTETAWSDGGLSVSVSLTNRLLSGRPARNRLRREDVEASAELYLKQTHTHTRRIGVAEAIISHMEPLSEDEELWTGGSSALPVGSRSIFARICHDFPVFCLLSWFMLPCTQPLPYLLTSSLLLPGPLLHVPGYQLKTHWFFLMIPFCCQPGVFIFYNLG